MVSNRSWLGYEVDLQVLMAMLFLVKYRKEENKRRIKLMRRIKASIAQG